MRFLRLTLFSTLVILLLCQSCSAYVGSQSRNLGEQESVQYFYERYPFLANKIQNLSAHVVKTAFRETIAYYQFSIDEVDLAEFLKRGKYVDVRNLTDREKNHLFYNSDNELVEFRCNVNFIKIPSQYQASLPWWDLKTLDNKTCYTQRPLKPSPKAVYDRKSKILYVYSYVAW
jgi:hypothetical protein